LRMGGYRSKPRSQTSGLRRRTAATSSAYRRAPNTRCSSSCPSAPRPADFTSNMRPNLSSHDCGGSSAPAGSGRWPPLHDSSIGSGQCRAASCGGRRRTGDRSARSWRSRRKMPGWLQPLVGGITIALEWAPGSRFCLRFGVIGPASLVTRHSSPQPAGRAASRFRQSGHRKRFPSKKVMKGMNSSLHRSQLS